MNLSGERTVKIKMYLRYLVAAAALLLMTTPLRATTITPGQSGVLPTDFGVVPTTLTPLDMVSGNFSLDGGAVAGSYGEGVIVDPFGLTCTGCLDFFFQLGESSTSKLKARHNLNWFRWTVPLVFG